jgi:hypothetical protein
MPLGLENLVELGFVGHGFNAFLKRQDVIVASHHGDGLYSRPLVPIPTKPPV